MSFLSPESVENAANFVWNLQNFAKLQKFLDRGLETWIFGLFVGGIRGKSKFEHSFSEKNLAKN